eukprot:10281455-Alexandrium_andersonii.AAC.1
MSASLVGSEMCIRDSTMASGAMARPAAAHQPHRRLAALLLPTAHQLSMPCLLYTSDAADDM